MSNIYSVDGKIDLDFSKKNVMLVLKKAFSAKLAYHTFKKIVTDTDTITKPIDLEQLALRMIIENEKQIEDAPFLLTDNQESLHIKMHKTITGKIEISWFGLNPERKKYFPEKNHGMDFAYYIEKFVDLYSEFTIISLEASYF